MGKDAAARSWRPLLTPAVLFLGLALLLAGLAVATPYNHDEDQYLAASVLAAKARLYSDFAYVQAPLYPWLAAPLTSLAPGWTYLVLRLFSAACGLAALLGVAVAQHRLGVPRRAAWACVLLMASCYTFQYCSSVVRNDALPMALLAWAIVAACRAFEDGPRPWLDWSVCGLLLGAGVSAKVSYAPLLAVTGVAVAGRLARLPVRTRLQEAAGFGFGAGVGFSPIAMAYAGAPEAVRFALIGFWADGPRRWYVANGLGQRMRLGFKLLYGLGDMALGPALAALAVVLFSRLGRGRDLERGSAGAGLLDLMIVAGLAAAFSPSPTFKQYFAPLLAPLFVRLGLAARGGWPRWARPALIMGAATGVCVMCLKVGPDVRTGRWPAIAVARENHWVGDTLRRAGSRGAVATLSAHAVLDSGYRLDRRFAGGAMLYRSADGVDPGLRRRLGIISPSSLASGLDATPPAAIVTGYEHRGGDTRVDLDKGLRAYAEAQGYVLHRSPWADVELYVRPVTSAHVSRAHVSR